MEKRFAGLPYQEYLQTEHWQYVREGAIRRADGRCSVCNGTGRLDAHHRTYERIGAEWETDVIALCRDCYSLFHDKLATAPKTISDGADLRNAIPPRARILQTLRRHRSADVAAIAEETGLSRFEAEAGLGVLADQGRAEKLGSGEWRMIDRSVVRP